MFDWSFQKRGPWDWYINLNFASLDSILTNVETSFQWDRLPLLERENGSDKIYRFAQKIVYSEVRTADLSTEDVEKIPPLSSLLQYLRGTEYRQRVANIGECDLSQSSLEVVFNLYSQGCFISPHTDRVPKRLTQLIYLGGTRPGTGGEFLVMTGPETVIERVNPLAGSSIIFQRSPASWHAVSRVIAPGVFRKSIQIVFWDSSPPPAAPGRKGVAQ